MKKKNKIILLVAILLLAILGVTVGVMFTKKKGDGAKKINKIELKDKKNALEYGKNIVKVKDVVVMDTRYLYSFNPETIDLSKVGKQKIKVVKKLGDKVEEFEFVIEVKDTVKPELKIKEEKVSIIEGDEYNPLNNVEYCKDKVDGDLQAEIKGDFDSNKVNKYNLKAVCKDKNNNETSKSFEVEIIKKESKKAEEVKSSPKYQEQTRPANKPNRPNKPNNNGGNKPSNPKPNQPNQPVNPPKPKPNNHPLRGRVPSAGEFLNAIVARKRGEGDNAGASIDGVLQNQAASFAQQLANNAICPNIWHSGNQKGGYKNDQEIVIASGAENIYCGDATNGANNIVSKWWGSRSHYIAMSSGGKYYENNNKFIVVNGEEAIERRIYYGGRNKFGIACVRGKDRPDIPENKNILYCVLRSQETYRYQKSEIIK